MIEKEEFYGKVRAIFKENELSEYLKDEIIEKFYALTEIMLETNEKMNITAITEEDAVIARHYADSLLLLRADIEEGAEICDVGCGGGFPSFPIAIVRPDIKITGIDSTAKKVAYVNETAKKLGLTNLTAVSGRAEELASGDSEMRESFDYVCARAVAALPVLSELCMPFVKVGGKFIALKAKSGREELENSLFAIKKLGGEIEKSEEMFLCDRTLGGEERAERMLIEVKKTARTGSGYPRAYAQIKKKPL